MLIQTATSDLIRVITSAAVTVDVHASWVDHTLATDNVVAGRTNTLITTATTTTIVAAPASGDTRNTQFITARNRHASTATDVTVTFEQSGAVVHEMFKVTLLAGQTLEYTDDLGFYVITSQQKTNVMLRATADTVNSTTSMADVAGLTYPIESGKHYGFEAQLFSITSGTTIGHRYAVNGPAVTEMRVSAVQVVTGSVTAAAMSAPVGDITALDTIIIGQTTGPATVVPAMLYGWVNPSAAGTFAIRQAAETTGSVTTKKGSWLHLWEFDN